jgi:DHA2 family multidrug resistance protein-like MFS transporter
MVGLAAPIAGRLATRMPAGLLSSAGLVVLAAALYLLASLGPGAGTLDIVLCMLLAGLGYGLFLPPNSATQIGSVPKARSGGASSMGATARVFGQAIGTAGVALSFGLAADGGSARALAAASVVALAGAAISASRGASRPRG